MYPNNQQKQTHDRQPLGEQTPPYSKNIELIREGKCDEYSDILTTSLGLNFIAYFVSRELVTDYAR